jgi:DNA-binding NtrC family response regulator
MNIRVGSPPTVPKANVLVVEDEAVVARDLECSLERLGYASAGWVATGEEAVERVAERLPDLVLMDIRLKGSMDGIQAAGRIREDHGVPVVFVTAFADEETLDRAKVADPFGYILKPFTERDLVTTIEMALYKHNTDRVLKEREQTLEQALAGLESANERLASQRGFLHALFEHAPWSVLVLDRDYTVRMFNRQLKEMFEPAAETGADAGLSVGETLRCLSMREGSGTCGTMEACLTCQIHESHMDAIDGKTTRRKKCTFDFVDRGQKRAMSLLVTAAPFDFEGQRQAIVMLEDTTELDGLRSLMRSKTSFAGIVGAHSRMLEIFDTIREVADVNAPVMVLGESGTGKELVARAIHTEGSRCDANFVPVNCAALPDSLLESELFGHVKGAYTGAVRDRKGRFELADKGTIFLDEIGDLSASVQVKLLRVLQEGSFERVGGEKTVSVDARVICATNKNLEREVEEGNFREDLYYRLCVVPINVPPLRDRIDDVPLLAEHILERESVTSGNPRATLLPEVAAALASFHWPGNVRELQNALQYALIKSKGDAIGMDHLPPSLRNVVAKEPRRRRGRQKLSTATVADALRETAGNKREAAKVLGVSRATLYRFLDDNPVSVGG